MIAQKGVGREKKDGGKSVGVYDHDWIRSNCVLVNGEETEEWVINQERQKQTNVQNSEKIKKLKKRHFQELAWAVVCTQVRWTSKNFGGERILIKKMRRQQTILMILFLKTIRTSE